MLVLYGMYNSIQFGSVEDKSTTHICMYIHRNDVRILDIIHDQNSFFTQCEIGLSVGMRAKVFYSSRVRFGKSLFILFSQVKGKQIISLDMHDFPDLLQSMQSNLIFLVEFLYREKFAV